MLFCWQRPLPFQFHSAAVTCSGAGKSSLIAALLRLTEISKGQILLGGRDTRQIPLPALRQMFGVVPQTPFLFQASKFSARSSVKSATPYWQHLKSRFSVPQFLLALQGTVRENLDPMKVHRDRDMIAVLRAVQLWDILCGIGLSLRKTPTRPVQAVAARMPMAIVATSSLPIGELACCLPHHACLSQPSSCTACFSTDSKHAFPSVV